jgi:uncharacterized protein YpuA (DUF1002 family)
MIKMKRYKIVNKKKFTRFICILALLIIGITYTTHTLQTDWTDEYTTTKVYVQSGDTLWSIAEQYVPDGIDIRDYMYEIRELNNMTTSDVYAGDVITVYEKGGN